MEKQFRDLATRVCEALHDSNETGLILLAGPAHRGVDVLHALTHSCDRIAWTWWTVAESPPSPPGSSADRPSVLLVTGFESLPEDEVRARAARLLQGTASWTAQGGKAVVWVPVDASDTLHEALGEHAAQVSLELDIPEAIAPLDPDLEARRRYAAQVLLTLGFRPLHSLASERYLRALEDFFVEPTVMTDQGPLPVLTWAQSTHSGVLLGPAGGGKSICLAAIALARARACEENPVGSGLSILASARDILPRLEADEPGSPAEILSTCAATTWDDPQRIQTWAAGGCLQLLVDDIDALDETSSRRLGAWLQDLRSSYPRMGVIVSGRHPMADLGDEWRTGRILPFSGDQVEGYANRYFRLVEPAYRTQLTSSLLESLEEAPWLRDIAAHPFYLLSLCMLVARQGSLPRVRVRILEFLIESMLSRWEIGGASDWTQRALREEIHDDLSQLALNLKLNDTTEFGTEDIREVAQRTRVSPETIVTAETLLQAPLQAGIVKATKPGRYTFVHSAFQDYLAVEPIVGDIEHGVERLTPHLTDPAWRDLIVLGAGMAVRRHSWKVPDLLHAIWPDETESNDDAEPHRAERLALALDAILEAEQDSETLAHWMKRADRALETMDPAAHAGRSMLEAAIGRVARRIETTEG